MKEFMAPVQSDFPVRGRSRPREGRINCIGYKGFHRIYYRDWGKTTSAETVFCLHGLTRNSRDFDPLAAVLARKRRIVCPDLVGRGQSEWLADGDGYQLPQYNVDFNALVNRIGCETFDIIGTSLGGLMGMAMAGMPKSPVRRLVVNDVAPEVPLTALRRLSNYLGEDPRFDSMEELEAYLRITFAPFGPMTDADWKRMAKTSARETDQGIGLAYDPAISYHYQRYWLLSYLDLWSYWRNISCPVLILRGAESDFLTQPLVTKMLESLPCAELIEFEGVGHTPTLNAAEQIEPIRRWLDTN